MDLAYGDCKDILLRLDEEADHALFNAETSSGSHSPHDYHSSTTDHSSSSPDSMRYNMYGEPAWDQNQTGGSPIYNVGRKEGPTVDSSQPWVPYTEGTAGNGRFVPAMTGAPFTSFTKVEDVDFLADPANPSNPHIFNLGDIPSLPVQGDYSFLNDGNDGPIFFPQKSPYNNDLDYRDVPGSTFPPKTESVIARDGFSSVSWQLGSETSSTPQTTASVGYSNSRTQSQSARSSQSGPAGPANMQNNSSSGSELDSEGAKQEVSPTQGKKRKLSDSQDEEPKGRKSRSGNKVKVQPKKTAHNMIEKRYRTNLNDKIAQLRDAVPSLRIMAGSSKLGDGDEEELDGLTPAHKLNKATVLSKATEYIHHLEKRAKRLSEENEELKHQIKALEARAAISTGETQIRNSMSRPGASLMPRVIVAGMTGLMALNQYSGDPDRPGTHGLAAIPFPFVNWLGSEGSVLSAAKIFLFLGAIIFIFMPSLLESKPKDDPKSPSASLLELSAAPSLASSLEVRRKAWLTAIQTVWVPRHSFMLELAALGLKFLKLSVRKLVGWNGYSLITGTTPEQEAARVKAWLIALDAQLAGGDAEISRSRICLTFLASFTLPATPYRLMLNALHTRVLEWTLQSGAWRNAAKRASSYFWSEARKMQATIEKESENPDVLPDYLARLLALEDDEVLLDRIVQRAYNLAYNHNTETEAEQDEGMDTVVEDFAIRTPLDALAAWYSSLLLHKVLVAALDVEKPDKVMEMKETMTTAIAIAPPSSGARVRATYTNAFLFGNANGRELKSIVQELKAERGSSRRVKPILRELVPRNTAVTVTHDIRLSLRCAMALYFLRQDGKETVGLELFRALDCRPKSIINGKAFTSGMGLLGFVAALRLMFTVAQHYNSLGADSDKVEDVSGMLRLWIGGYKGTDAGIDTITRRKLTDVCVAYAKRAGGYSEDDFEVDAGYATADYSSD